MNQCIPSVAKNKGGVDIFPLIVGDYAFPFRKWMMKSFTNSVLTQKQKNFNYRLSRARMVTEGAYGKLKGRWRVLYGKCEIRVDNVKTIVLACIVLHNIYTDRGDSAPRQWDLSRDPASNKKRPRD